MQHIAAKFLVLGKTGTLKGFKYPYSSHLAGINEASFLFTSHSLLLRLCAAGTAIRLLHFALSRYKTTTWSVVIPYAKLWAGGPCLNGDFLSATAQKGPACLLAAQLSGWNISSHSHTPPLLSSPATNPFLPDCLRQEPAHPQTSQ